MSDGPENLKKDESEHRARGVIEFPRSPEEITARVAIAIIEKDGKFLIYRREKERSYVGKWAFPGGKLEVKETAKEGLVREVREELGVAVGDIRPFLEWDYKFPDGNIFHLIGFRCEVVGDPKPLVASELQWVSTEEMLQYDLLESTGPIFTALQSIELAGKRALNP